MDRCYTSSFTTNSTPLHQFVQTICLDCHSFEEEERVAVSASAIRLRNLCQGFILSKGASYSSIQKRGFAEDMALGSLKWTFS